MLGQILDGRYRILRELGAGAFGRTYLAQDTRLPGEPACVVKRLQPISIDPATLEFAERSFLKEAEILQKLGTHDQIPRLLAFFKFDSQFFLVQELVEGNDLSQEIGAGRKWTEPEARQLLAQILSPLTFIHECNVIHRDLKPSNLMR